MTFAKKLLLSSFAFGTLLATTGLNDDVSANETTYTVQAGDTLSQISSKTGVSVGTLAQVNNISNINVIFPGKTLTLNGQVGPAQKATPTQAPKTQVASAQTTAVPQYVYQVVEAEAGPSLHEKKMVMSVILNRVNSGRWGGTDFMSVVTAPGQFEVHAIGAAAAKTPSQDTINAVNDIMANGPITSAESFRATGDGVTNYFF